MTNATMPPDIDAPLPPPTPPPNKMSAAFNLTDIEDIDAFSDDVDPSSDDDTFISHRNAMRVYEEENNVPHDDNNASATTLTDEKQVENNNNVNIQPRLEEDSSLRSRESSSKPESTSSNGVSLKLNDPTNHFTELERQMNGSDWMNTSSSESCSENELGALERDEFTFKMCQIIKRNKRVKRRKNRRASNETSVSAKPILPLSDSPKPTIPLKASSKPPEPNDSAMTDSDDSDDGNMLKFCNSNNGNVPLVTLDEEDL